MGQDTAENVMKNVMNFQCHQVTHFEDTTKTLTKNFNRQTSELLCLHYYRGTTNMKDLLKIVNTIYFFDMLSILILHRQPAHHLIG